eukprot:2044082-Rhodomonas_salina.1
MAALPATMAGETGGAYSGGGVLMEHTMAGRGPAGLSDVAGGHSRGHAPRRTGQVCGGVSVSVSLSLCLAVSLCLSVALSLCLFVAVTLEAMLCGAKAK